MLEKHRKWVTREKAKVDRIACPWLIKNFVDSEPVFLFVPAEKVLDISKEQNAIPFDVPDVELGHHDNKCSFDAIIEKYDLKDPALLELAKIVRGADTDDPHPTAESAGLEAMAEGFRQITNNDFDNMNKQFYVYDALYAYCNSKLSEQKRSR